VLGASESQDVARLHGPSGSGNTYLVETPLARATRELREQEAALRAPPEPAAEPPKAPEPKRVQLVLELTYDNAGVLTGVQGLCQGRKVLNTYDRVGVDLGAAAVRTLELGALGALLGP